MSFNYEETAHHATGKTTGQADIFEGRFVKLEPNKLIVKEEHLNRVILQTRLQLLHHPFTANK
jgi:hypothetical protein